MHGVACYPVLDHGKQLPAGKGIIRDGADPVKDDGVVRQYHIRVYPDGVFHHSAARIKRYDDAFDLFVSPSAEKSGIIPAFRKRPGISVLDCIYDFRCFYRHTDHILSIASSTREICSFSFLTDSAAPKAQPLMAFLTASSSTSC